MREYYARNKEYWRNYYKKKKKVGKKNLRKASITSQKHFNKVRNAWFGVEDIDSINAKPKDKKQNWKKLIKLVSKEILPAEGFTDIKVLNVSNKDRMFLFDILAINGENKCGIVCTTSYVKILAKNIFEKLKLFLEFFDIEVQICFVKPDFSKYLLVKIDRNKPKTLTMGLGRIQKMKAIQKK